MEGISDDITHQIPAIKWLERKTRRNDRCMWTKKEKYTAGIRKYKRKKTEFQGTVIPEKDKWDISNHQDIGYEYNYDSYRMGRM